MIRAFLLRAYLAHYEILLSNINYIRVEVGVLIRIESLHCFSFSFSSFFIFDEAPLLHVVEQAKRRASVNAFSNITVESKHAFCLSFHR